jgi:hypothetical protein
MNWRGKMELDILVIAGLICGINHVSAAVYRNTIKRHGFSVIY